MYTSTRSILVALLLMGGCATLHTRPLVNGSPKKAPDFVLSAQNGAQVSSAAARANGPLVVVFYRGHW